MSQVKITGFGMMGGDPDTAYQYVDRFLVAVRTICFPDYVWPSSSTPPYYLVFDPEKKEAPIAAIWAAPVSSENEEVLFIKAGKPFTQPNGYTALEIDRWNPTVIDFPKVWAQDRPYPFNRIQFASEPATPPTESEPNMTATTGYTQSAPKKLLANNVQFAKNAAMLEAGRMANKQLTKMIAKKAKVPGVELLDTPLGRVVVANVASLAVQHFYASHKGAEKLTNAMMMAAFQEAIQMIDLDGMMDEFMNSKAVKKAVKAVEAAEE